MTARTQPRRETMLVEVHPNTLSVTHIFDGEEVVTGGEDGQVWVATFASSRVARAFVADRVVRGAPVMGQREVKQ